MERAKSWIALSARTKSVVKVDESRGGSLFFVPRDVHGA